MHPSVLAAEKFANYAKNVRAGLEPPRTYIVAETLGEGLDRFTYQNCAEMVNRLVQSSVEVDSESAIRELARVIKRVDRPWPSAPEVSGPVQFTVRAGDRDRFELTVQPRADGRAYVLGNGWMASRGEIDPTGGHFYLSGGDYGTDWALSGDFNAERIVQGKFVRIDKHISNGLDRRTRSVRVDLPANGSLAGVGADEHGVVDAGMLAAHEQLSGVPGSPTSHVARFGPGQTQEYETGWILARRDGTEEVVAIEPGFAPFWKQHVTDLGYPTRAIEDTDMGRRLQCQNDAIRCSINGYQVESSIPADSEIGIASDGSRYPAIYRALERRGRGRWLPDGPVQRDIPGGLYQKGTGDVVSLAQNSSTAHVLSASMWELLMGLGGPQVVGWPTGGEGGALVASICGPDSPYPTQKVAARVLAVEKGEILLMADDEILPGVEMGKLYPHRELENLAWAHARAHDLPMRSISYGDQYNQEG